MAAPGETIINKVTGEKLTFVRTPGSSQGMALELEWWVPEGSRLVALPHRHPTVTEYFEILEGEAQYRVGRERRREAAPHRFDVPSDTAHVHPANAGRGPLRVRQWAELEQPDAALLDEIARYFETVSALASEGRVDQRGLIRNPLQFALTISESLMPGTYLSFPPPWAQRPPVIALAALLGAPGFALTTSHRLTRGKPETTPRTQPARPLPCRGCRRRASDPPSKAQVSWWRRCSGLWS